MLNGFDFEMQGVVFMPQNPQQGSPPPISSTLVTDDIMDDPDVSTNTTTSKYQKTIINQSDSGIFSTTATTIDQMDLSSNTENFNENRSDCSSPERKYVCPICDTMLTSQHEFTLHIRSHNNESDTVQDKGYTCRICNKILSSSSSLDRHVLVHSGERPFHCKYCGDTFTTNGNMHRHMRTHSHKTEYESDGSTDSSTSGKNIEYNNNKVEKSNKRKFETTDYSSIKKLEIHHQDYTPQSYKCPVCERSDFDSIINLEAHLEDNHPEYPAKCNQCNQTFQNNKLLTLHKATHESPTSRHHVVGFKDLTFVDFSSEKFPHIARYECERNLHKVAGGLKFQCRQCQRAFPCSSSLEIHEKECPIHLNGLDLSKTTTISENEIRRSEFFSRLDLQDNSPEKTSPIGETSTRLRQQLLAKAITMDSTKDLADIQSIISMTTNGSLLQQLQNKELPQSQSNKDIQDRGEQEEESQDAFAVEFRKMKLRGEFPCRLCTAVFPNLRALKGHNRAHLNGNNNGTYRCNMCPHLSNDKAALIRHMRTHNGDRPYECSLCNYAFTTKANCERHLRNRHAKTTREEVKKAIIYHPSEDPTNEDLNKLTKDDFKKPEIEKLNFTPKPLQPELKPELIKLKESPIFSNINEIIRNENLKSLKEHKNGPLLPPYNFTPQPTNISTPYSASKIQIKNISDLKYDESDSENNDDGPIDLSKKKEEKKPILENSPQDLTKKPMPPPLPTELFAQHLIKAPPQFDHAALYATQLALYRNSLSGFPNWPCFPLNPLFNLQNPILSQDPQEIKERIQRYQLCGGSMITDNFAEKLKNFQNFRNFKLNELKPEPIEKKEDKPITLKTVEQNFNDNLKIHSPIPPPPKPDIIHSPNSVKMVIKNGVLMPKQKQRRYRTERPFTCEHCSARFTLRSNMERHIKQQHPQYWQQRQRGNIGTPGRKQNPIKSMCDLNIPNYEMPKMDFEETKDLTVLAQHLKQQQQHEQLNYHLQKQQQATKKDDDDDCGLIIDENENKNDKTDDKFESSRILEEKLKELHAKKVKNEENQDLVPVSRLLVNASQQQFKEYFKREGEEQELGGGSEEDEEGLVASGSTSEGNISGTDENRSESEVPSAPVKKKSAYSMAPNRVSCPFCSRKFPWSSSLRRHILTHTGQKPFKCSHCPLLFTTKSNCDRHLLRKHGNNATTITNDSINNNTNYLMRNVPERPFKCSNCPSSTFSTYSNLKKHITSKHATNAQGDDIKAQGYEAGSSEDEKQNVEIKNEWEPVSNQTTPIANSDLPFKCHLCDGSFGERQDALDHIKSKHYSEYDLLMSKNALDTNATTPDEHHDDDDSEIRGKFPDYSNRKVICAFCMRRFWSAEDLRRHMRTHTGERPFSCDICRRRFTLKHSMLRHRKKHNVNFDHENAQSDEDLDKFIKSDNNNINNNSEKVEESDGNEGGDLISNLLGIRDRSFIDKVLTASADDAAKLLGVKNGAKE